MNRPKIRLVVGALLACATLSLGLLPLAGADASGRPRFTLSPSPLNISGSVGQPAYGTVTVANSRGPLVIENPATFSPSTFTDGSTVWDTQAGTCWQSYESLGNKIPGHSDCTIQVGFTGTQPGNYTATMVVYQCKSWHTGSAGEIVCDTRGSSLVINVVGHAS